jgi:primosomal protein N' (replication factor Y)
MEGQRAEGAIFIGPALAPIARINDVYRMAIYVKHDDYDKLVMLKDVLERYIKELEQMGELKGVVTQFDFDPMHG